MGEKRKCNVRKEKSIGFHLDIIWLICHQDWDYHIQYAGHENRLDMYNLASIPQYFTCQNMEWFTAWLHDILSGGIVRGKWTSLIWDTNHHIWAILMSSDGLIMRITRTIVLNTEAVCLVYWRPCFVKMDKTDVSFYFTIWIMSMRYLWSMMCGISLTRYQCYIWELVLLWKWKCLICFNT